MAYLDVAGHLCRSQIHATEAEFELPRTRNQFQQENYSQSLDVVSTNSSCGRPRTYCSRKHSPILYAHVPNDEAASVNAKRDAHD
jgi:hypothetical protein